MTAEDEFGQTATDSFDYAAVNVDPTVTSLTPDATTIMVGQSVTWSATVSDPGTDDTHTFSFNGGAFGIQREQERDLQLMRDVHHDGRRAGR